MTFDIEFLEPFEKETFKVQDIKDEKFKQIISFELNLVEYVICLSNKSIYKHVITYGSDN